MGEGEVAGGRIGSIHLNKQKMNNEITGFPSWKIPSGEGVLYIEGAPTKEERNENLRRTSESRKVWQPDINAL